MGYLSIYTEWEANSFQIAHVLSGDNYEITQGIVYNEILNNAPKSPNTDGI